MSDCHFQGYALPSPLKWSVQDNRFDDSVRNPKALSVAIPLESIPALIDHLMKLESDKSKHKTIKAYDFDSNEETEITAIYLNGKGKDGEYGGPFGLINPAKIATDSDLPF